MNQRSPSWIPFVSLHCQVTSGRYQQDLNKMAASHDGLLRVSSSPGHLQMSCTSDFIALPLTKTIVGVWWAGDLTRKPLQLSGHSKIISATCFGQKDRPLLLCTASEDFIYIWNIDKILAVDNISKIYLTIIHRRRGEHWLIFTKTKSR
ncbi:uncharacterized protein LOC110044683 [Orbicella faveolata]|uniref:uncharacterized protein LOC110044683 n=1 Tax=Orbicella faveolata TaxID=48498 RepID=UPI0009E2B7DF|nr:uncharacterized protein LOC110044683 [Orbicella faveolata]